MSSLTLSRYTVGPLQENCYLLADEDSRDAVLIDPGDEPQRLLDALSTDQLTLREIWLTHAHFDHVGALGPVLAAHAVPVRMHPADESLLSYAQTAASQWGFDIPAPPTNYEPLKDKQQLNLAGHSFTCLFTPGHAPGHIAFYCPAESFVISGDALFRGSIGRTDLPLGNPETLLNSIRTQLLTLPEDTAVYPGHGPETSVGLEQRTNPFF